MIQWTEKLIPIKDLKDFEKNPRRIRKEDFEKLVDSIKQDGYHTRIKVSIDNKTIGGHQRKKALLEADFTEDDLIPVLVPDRELTREEFERINIRDNLPYGEFDFEILANEFNIDELVEWGFPEEWLVGDFGEEEPEEVKTKEKEVQSNTVTVKCPECGCEFTELAANVRT